ncbi:MAG: flagellar biosynthesis protein FlhB [Brevinemataceae bacterium]
MHSFLNTLPHWTDILEINNSIFESFDLQRFASAEDEGRTEEPSESKKRKSREEGNIPLSQELIGIIVFLAVFFTVVIFWKYFFDSLFRLMKQSLNSIDSAVLSQNNVQSLMTTLLYDILKILGPIFGIAVLSTLAASLAQTKFLFSIKKISPDFKRVFGNILPNLKKMFWSKQALFNLGKSMAKVIVVFGIAFIFLVNDLGQIISYIHMENNKASGLMFGLIVKFTGFSGIILLILAVIDYIFQYREYIESLKMTKQEVKEEFKEQEGNPEIKQKIRQLESKLGLRRMMSAVPSADVIITNPTHYAVAIKYDRSYMNAPIVVAKGTDRTALKIREIARENNIPIHENKPLARGLYGSVDVGDEIPYEFYKTVADILSLVYTKSPLSQRNVPIS